MGEDSWLCRNGFHRGVAESRRSERGEDGLEYRSARDAGRLEVKPESAEGAEVRWAWGVEGVAKRKTSTRLSTR